MPRAVLTPRAARGCSGADTLSPLAGSPGRRRSKIVANHPLFTVPDSILRPGRRDSGVCLAINTSEFEHDITVGDDFVARPTASPTKPRRASTQSRQSRGSRGSKARRRSSQSRGGRMSGFRPSTLGGGASQHGDSDDSGDGNGEGCTSTRSANGYQRNKRRQRSSSTGRRRSHTPGPGKRGRLRPLSALGSRELIHLRHTLKKAAPGTPPAALDLEDGSDERLEALSPGSQATPHSIDAISGKRRRRSATNAKRNGRDTPAARRLRKLEQAAKEAEAALLRTTAALVRRSSVDAGPQALHAEQAVRKAHTSTLSAHERAIVKQKVCTVATSAPPPAPPPAGCILR